MDETLFPEMTNRRPYKVRLPTLYLPLQHYAVRLFLLDQGWEEFHDWMICPYVHTEVGDYEVWFKDIAKATYFKLSFTV